MAPTTPTTVPLSTTTISFPRRQWAARDNRLTLTLTATAQLVWLPSNSASASASAAVAAQGTPPPPSSNIFHSATVPAARVAQLVRAGRLWIAADGRSVSLGINATLGGKSCSKSQQKTIRQMVADWPWAELGLECTDRGRFGTGGLVIGHPPSPDGLYAPRGIPHARMDRVDCQLRFNYCAEGVDLRAVKVVTAVKKVKTKRKVKKKIKTQDSQPKRQKQTQDRQQKTKKQDPSCLSDGRSAALIDAALAMLVGTAGRQVGARALDKNSLPSGAPSLLDIAPAVWSHHLFRAAASRAAHVPLIYRALSTFTNAQSPRLRRKAEALAGLPATADDAGHDQNQDELATKIEEILLKGTLFAPQRLKQRCRKKRPAPATQTHLPSPEQTQSQEDTVDMCQDELEHNFCDLDADSLEYAFSLSQDSVDDDGYIEGYGDGQSEAGESEAGEAVDWDDIEAWTEQYDEWPDADADEEADDDAEYDFYDFTGSWSPPASDGSDRDSADGADWADVADGQLDAALACDDRLCEPSSEADYQDIDEMGLDCMGDDDGSQADEAIGMWYWRSEQDMISRVL